MRAQKEKPDPATIPQEIRQAVEAASKEGRLSCAEAHRLAAELNASPLEVGRAADALGIRIVSCQLGCF